MTPTLMKRTITQVLAWTGVVVLCAGMALAQDASAASAPSQGQAAAQQGPRTDGQIEMDVVHALDASEALKNDLITAATIQGEVTLSGTVSSDASRQLAESIVSHVNGVTKVHNNLTVGNPGQDAQNMPPPPDSGSQDGPDNQQADASTPGLAPPGPAPDQYPAQGQYPPAAPNAQQPSYPQQYPPQGTYPPPGAYPPPSRPQYQRPGYSQYPPQPYQDAPTSPSYQPASGPVTIPAGTLMYLRTVEPVESKHAQDGQPVQFTVIQDVSVGGVLAIPRGATVHGVVTHVKRVGSGELAGSSELALTLTSLDLGGRSYPLQSDEFRVKGPNKAGQTVGNAVGAGLIGTIIGCAVGRGAGCAIGAGAGVAAGTAASAASSGPRAWIPAEALVKFHTAGPLTVDPVNPQEAARLAEGLYPGGPSLYRRPYPRSYYGYTAYPYAPYGAYGYPAPFYRPYFVVGGAYYWR